MKISHTYDSLSSLVRKILLAVVLLSTVSYTYAFAIPEKPTGYVNDYANVLSVDTKSSLEAKLTSFTASTTHEIAVVIIPELGNETIESYAVKLFEKWKIGKEKEDNGVLFLIAIQDRTARIEVGYGLEGILPDAIASQILKGDVTPLFKEGKYDEGIIKGVEDIMSVIQGEILQGETKSNLPSIPIDILLGGIFLVGTFLAEYLARTRAWWQGGIIGAILGSVFGFIFHAGTIMLVVSSIGFALFGLLIDFFLSRSGPGIFGRGGHPGGVWGGFGGGSMGRSSFGGFGGGSSGGGGSSSSW